MLTFDQFIVSPLGQLNVDWGYLPPTNAPALDGTCSTDSYTHNPVNLPQFQGGSLDVHASALQGSRGLDYTGSSIFGGNDQLAGPVHGLFTAGNRLANISAGYSRSLQTVFNDPWYTPGDGTAHQTAAAIDSLHSAGNAFTGEPANAYLFGDGTEAYHGSNSDHVAQPYTVYDEHGALPQEVHDERSNLFEGGYENALPRADFDLNEDLFGGAPLWPGPNPMGLSTSASALPDEVPNDNPAGYFDFGRFGEAETPAIPSADPDLGEAVVSKGQGDASEAPSTEVNLEPLSENRLFDMATYYEHQKLHQRETTIDPLAHVIAPAPSALPNSTPAQPGTSGSKRRNEDTADAGLTPASAPKKKRVRKNKNKPENSKVEAPADAILQGPSEGPRRPLADLEQTLEETTSTLSDDAGANAPFDGPPKAPLFRFGILCPHPSNADPRVRCNMMLLGGLKDLRQHIKNSEELGGHGGLSEATYVDGRVKCPLLKTQDSDEVCGETFKPDCSSFHRHIQTTSHIIQGRELDGQENPVGPVVRHPVYACPICKTLFAQHYGGRKDSVLRHLRGTKCGEGSPNKVEEALGKLLLAYLSV